MRGEFALWALFDLAMQPQGELVKAADIARRQKIPPKSLELILAELRQGGFVESRWGAEGGYRVARPAEQITVREVPAFIEIGKKTKRGTGDAFTDLWKRVDASIADSGSHHLRRTGPKVESVAGSLRAELGNLMARADNSFSIGRAPRATNPSREMLR
jgi:Rrf2 family protein